MIGDDDGTLTKVLDSCSVTEDEYIQAMTLYLLVHQKRIKSFEAPKCPAKKMHPEDTNVFPNGIIEKYANRPDDLENECNAKFVTGLVNVDTKDIVNEADIENYTTPVH